MSAVMATLLDPDNPDGPPEWAWPTEPNVTAALTAQLGRLQRHGLDDEGACFVLPHDMLPGLEMVDRIPVVRADVLGPIVAIPAPPLVS
jgi:hypothetical protein